MNLPFYYFFVVKNAIARSQLNVGSRLEHPEIDVEKEASDEANVGTEESQEALQKALDTFREQALKFQGISHEAYEAYSKKAIVILNDTAE
ncbi:hypothetical protein RIF29_29235 [Crotalaria pallida]|uniref:Uncharacterized protein n=1 Tax=Crotalaria pallida TaxID=3830 RepID=A0AAN9EKY4_CROPI